MSFPTPDPSTPGQIPENESQEPRLLTRREDPPAPITEHPRPTLFVPSLRHRAHFHLRRILITVGTLTALVAFAFILTSLWLRHSMRASLPQLDGALHAPGLTQPVTVTRNAQGVPSIQAANLDDLLFAQGFVTAQDRLFQMDLVRRHASGELAEILGSNLVDHDRLQRTLQIRTAADNATAALPADQRHQLDAYANGVNAFITQNANHLPVEFHLLHYKPAPWTARDSLLVSLAMYQDLSTGFPVKLRREALAAHLPADLLADLYPVGSWRDVPPSQPQPDLTTIKPEVEQIPLDRSQSKLETPNSSHPDCLKSGCPGSGSSDPGLHDASVTTPTDILRIAREFPDQQCEGCRAGSNNWAIAASRSASGGALLSNDTHLSLSVPDTWYEAGLHAPATATSPELNVTGFTLPGIPFIIVGRNQHVAWGFTNLGADVQDLRVEHLRGSGSNTEYQQPNGSWAPVAHHTEYIRVARGRNITLDVLTTTETVGSTQIATPILSPLFHSERRAISLAWTIYDPSNVTSPFLNVNTASTGASLVAAFATFGGPSLNLIYADDAKHIGYHAIGRIPIRGPADHHPRAAAPAIPIGPPPPDEDQPDQADPDQPQPDQQQPSNAPQGELATPAPTFTLAAFTRSSRTSRARTTPTRTTRTRTTSSRTTTTRITTTPGAPGPDSRTRVSHNHHRQSKTPLPTHHIEIPEPPAPPIAETVTPTVTDYTIGSPISPTPVDALDASQIWSGYIPFNELPSVVDPPSGILATANSRVTADDYPYAIALNWAPPYRVERINKVLSKLPPATPSFTPADMLALQNDVHSEFDLVVAQRLAYALDHASPSALSHDPKRLHQAADILRTWDGEVSVNAAAPTIVAAARSEIWAMLLLSKITAHDKNLHKKSSPQDVLALYDWSEQSVALEALLQHTPDRWLPTGFANWNDFLTSALEHALQEANAPSDLANWHYGPSHPVDIEHPIFSANALFNHLLGIPTGSGPHPTGGDTTTVKSIRLNFGPSERFTADLANPQATLGNITTGQSGNPASPNYLDQFLPWLNGTTYPLPLTPTQQTHTLTLLP